MCLKAKNTMACLTYPLSQTSWIWRSRLSLSGCLDSTLSFIVTWTWRLSWLALEIVDSTKTGGTQPLLTNSGASGISPCMSGVSDTFMSRRSTTSRSQRQRPYSSFLLSRQCSTNISSVSPLIPSPLTSSLACLFRLQSSSSTSTLELAPTKRSEASGGVTSRCGSPFSLVSHFSKFFISEISSQRSQTTTLSGSFGVQLELVKSILNNQFRLFFPRLSSSKLIEFRAANFSSIESRVTLLGGFHFCFLGFAHSILLY